MTRSVTDTLRGLLVITMMLEIRGQTLRAQAAPTASSPDPAPARAPSTSGPDWTGFYIAHTGVSSGASAWSATGPGVPNTSGSLDIFQPYGVFDGSGSQFDNHRLSSRVVIGVEADLSFAAEPVVAAATYHDAPELFGTARARVGYDAKRWLYYTTGGLAWTHDQYSRAGSNAGPAGGPPGGIVDVAFAGRIGWTVGGGIEAAVAPGWTAKAEYLYTRFGNTGVATGRPSSGIRATGPRGPACSISRRSQQHRARPSLRPVPDRLRARTSSSAAGTTRQAGRGGIREPRRHGSL